MGGFGSVTHWIILLVIVLLVFGTKKLRNIGGDLGGAVKNFKDSMKPEDADKKPEQLAAEQAAKAAGQTIEGEVKDKQKS